MWRHLYLRAAALANQAWQGGTEIARPDNMAPDQTAAAECDLFF